MLNTSKLQDPEESMPITQVKFKQNIKTIVSTKTVIASANLRHALLDCVSEDNTEGPFQRILLEIKFLKKS